jgi:hypothetical protein
MMNMLKLTDDYAHEPSENPTWRESYYFNWVDIETGISGFSTIGLLPNAQKSEFVFVLFYENEREVYFVEPEGAIPDDFKESISSGVLSYELVEPFKEWHIVYTGDTLNADFRWIARFPAYDFGGGSGTSWKGHFEQSGVLVGTVRLPDRREINIKGLSERDKSWGERDWYIEGWYAFHAQFDDFSIGLRYDTVKGEKHLSGGISSKSGNIRLEKLEVDTKFIDTPIRMPVGATTKVHGVDGKCYTFKSTLISPRSFIRFEREFPDGRTELFENMVIHECEELGTCGTGLTEWLFTYKNG